MTRKENGLFLWSERTIKKITESNGSDSIKQKQMKLTVCVLGLFLNLLLDKDENLSRGSFMDPFMGSFNFANTHK